MAEKIGVEAVFDLGSWNANLSKYQSGLSQAEGATGKFTGTLSKGWNDLGSTVTKATAVMGGAMVAAAGAASAAIAGFAVSGIKKAADLESQLGGIAAVLNKSFQEVLPLKQLILDLAVDPNLKVSATEAAAAVEMLARNGLSMTEIMGGAAKATVLLANATGADFGTAADIATDAMAIFKIEAQDVEKAVNGIVSVTTSSKFTINDYALALAQGGGVAAAVGVEFDDFNTTIAAISPLFKSGSDAGTSLKTMLLRLVPGSKAAAEAMEELGLITEDGKNQFFDANGQLKSMAEISEILSVATKDLTEEQKNQMLAVIFGTDAMRAAAGAAEAGETVYTDLATAMEETGLSQDVLNRFMEDGKITAFELVQAQQSLTDANQQAATRVNNLKGQMEVFWSVVEGLQIQIGDKFLPVLTELMKIFTDLVAQHTPAIIAAFSAFATHIESAVNFVLELVTGSGDLATAFGKLTPPLQTVALGIGAVWLAMQAAGKFLSETVGQYVQWSDVLIVLGVAITSVVVPAIISMMAAMAPLLLVFAGAVAAVAGLRIAWESNFLGIQDVTTNALSSIQSLWQDLVGFFEPSIERLKLAFDSFGEKFGGLSAKFSELWQAAQPVLTGLATLIGGVVMVVVVAAIETIAQLITRIADIVGVVVDQFTLMFTSIGAAWTEVVSLVTALVDGDWSAAWSSAQSLFQVAVGYINGTLLNLGALWGIVFAGLKTIVVNTFSAFGVDIAALLPQFVAKLGEWGAAAVAWITAAAPLAVAALGGFVSSLVTNVASRLSAWTTGWAAWATAAWQWITGAVSSGISAIVSYVSSLVTNVSARLSTWTSGWASWASAAWQWITGAVGSAVTALGGFVSSLITNLATRLSSWQAAFIAWATAAWQWIVDAAAELPVKVGEWYTKLAAELTSRLATWKTAFTEWATAAWQWIADATAELPAKIRDWYTKLKSELDTRLATWKTTFDDWKEAAVEWIADAKDDLPGKVSSWYTSLTTDVAAKLPTFKTEMLEWATALITWIGSSAADALPELGKWLGRIVAWIPLGVLALAAGLVKMAAALIGWIAGGEGTSAEQSAVGQTDPAMEEFKEALIQALENIKQGFILAVQEFVTEWKNTMTAHVDWNQVGQDVLNAVRAGVEAVRDAIYNTATLIAGQIKTRFTNIDWNQLGQDILTFIKDGVEAVKNTLLTKAGELAADIKKKFTDIDWKGIGEDVVKGIWDGMASLKDWLKEKVSGLTDALPQWAKDALGISSPSKVFAEIGRDIVRGLVHGIESTAPDARKAIERLTGLLLGSAARQRDNFLSSLAGNLSSAIGVGDKLFDQAAAFLDAWQERIGENNTMPGILFGRTQMNIFGEQKRVQEALQAQLDLIELVRSAGLNPRQVLGHIRFGASADPSDMLEVLNRVTVRLNQNLERTIQNIASGLDEALDKLRAMQKPVSDLEQRFSRVSGLVREDIFTSWRDQIARFDEQFEEVANRLLATSDISQLNMLHAITRQRTEWFNELDSYVRNLENLQHRLSMVPLTANERAQKSVEQFKQKVLDPLMQAMGPQNWTSITPRIQAAISDLTQFVHQLDRIEGIEKRLETLASSVDFGPAFQSAVQQALDQLYDPALAAGRRRQLLSAFDNYVAQAEQVFLSFNQLTSSGPDFERLRRTYIEPLLQRLLDINLTADERNRIQQEYNEAIARARRIDIWESQADALRDQLELVQKVRKLAEDLGSQTYLNQVFAGLDPSRVLSPQEFATVLERYTNLAVSQVQRDLREALKLPMGRDMERQLDVMRQQRRTFEDIERMFTVAPYSRTGQLRSQLDRWERLIEQEEQKVIEHGSTWAFENVKAFQKSHAIVAQQLEEHLRALYTAEQMAAGIQRSTVERAQQVADEYRQKFIDPLVAMVDQAILPSTRDALLQNISQRTQALNAYIRQLNSLAAWERDVSQAASINPLVGRFKADVIDKLLERLYDINTAESERVKIAQQLVAEQNKLLALQQKQQQLDFLKDQFSLLDQMKKLNEEFGEQVPLSDILAGIRFGVDASLDDMLTFTSRSIDAMIRVVKHQLGIGSPSKVFAQIGSQMMDGLKMGVQSSIAQPLAAIQGAIRSVPYSLNQRSLAVNMGGVTINNGMDDVMFEARVRQVVERYF